MLGDDELPAVVPDVDIGGSVRAIASSWYQTCARLDAGKLRCFGNGAEGRLGYGNTNQIGDDEAPACLHRLREAMTDPGFAELVKDGRDPKAAAEFIQRWTRMKRRALSDP